VLRDARPARAGRARPRRRLAAPAVVRRPWPVAAVAIGETSPDEVPEVPTTTVLPGAPSAATDVTRRPPPLIVMRPVRPPAPPPVPVAAPVAAGAPLAAVPTAPAPSASGPLPPRRAPIRRGHVPGTPVRVSRPVWGPPQPAV
jgi:translation initiation factor IF-2